jgi:hypothetical protein
MSRRRGLGRGLSSPVVGNRSSTNYDINDSSFSGDAAWLQEGTTKTGDNPCVVSEIVENNYHRIGKVITWLIGSEYTFVIRMKKRASAVNPVARISAYSGLVAHMNVNLTTGAISGVENFTNTAAVDEGGGVWRITGKLIPTLYQAIDMLSIGTYNSGEIFLGVATEGFELYSVVLSHA